MSKFNEIINSSTPTLIDFSAEWCQPCKMMPPILKEVKKQLGDKIRILKIDVDRSQAIAQKHQIQSVPTMMVFKNGKIVFRQSGVMQAGQIVQMLQTFS
jgi:thioredoxin 1